MRDPIVASDEDVTQVLGHACHRHLPHLTPVPRLARCLTLQLIEPNGRAEGDPSVVVVVGMWLGLVLFVVVGMWLGLVLFEEFVHVLQSRCCIVVCQLNSPLLGIRAINEGRPEQAIRIVAEKRDRDRHLWCVFITAE